MSIQDELRELGQKLKTERDHLKLQAHLMNAELKDEWEKAENQWHQFETRLAQKKHAIENAGDDVAKATRSMGEELREAYRRLRRSI